MTIFRRRRNKWLKDVITNECGTTNDKINESVAGEILYRESAMPSRDAELAADPNFGSDTDVNVGVTENAPYHNMSDYTMIGNPNEDNTVDTQKS